MFRRRKNSEADDVNVASHDQSVEPDESDAPDDGAEAPAAPRGVETASAEMADAGSGADPVVDRSSGPFDVTEVDLDEGRIDFGSLLVSPVSELEVQVQADQNTGLVSVITLVLGRAAAQVQVFAAPKSAGLWREIRAEIIDAIRASGGIADEVSGPFGLEIAASVQPTGGPPGLAPARFVGIDGPRWFLRAILLGDAAIQGPAAADIEDAFRGLVVNRGNAAIAPREPLPMRIPGVPDAAPSATLPNPFERGPEITEIR